MYAILNKIIIQGRLTTDPELRYTQNQTAVASFTVAVERDYSQNGEKETDFVSCVAWRSTGEFVNKYFHKGNMIIVDGRLQSRKWTDKDGNKRVSWEINAEHCYFGESKRSDSAEPRSDSNAPVPEYKGPEQQKFVDLGVGDGDGELPI